MNPGSTDERKAPLADASRIRTAYRFGTTSIDVDIDDPGVARWLAGFFLPWFSIEAPDGTGPQVRMTGCAEKYTALARREQKNNLQPFPCFGLDSRLVSLPGWIESDGATFLSDKELGCYYRLRGNQVDVVSRPQDRQARIGLMRVLRELATSCAPAQTDSLDLHAAAFVFRGRAILLAGGKHAGKTTLLAHALTSHHTALMANDRVIVSERQWQAHGVPTIVSVRGPTERTFPLLGSVSRRRAFLLYEGETEPKDFADAGRKALLALSPAQFGRQMKSRVEPYAPVGAILFPQISASARSLSLESLSSSEMAACLRESIYGSRSATRGHTIFQKIAGALPDTGVRESVLDRLAASVPLMRCLLGRNAYAESAEDWLKALPLGTAQQ